MNMHRLDEEQGQQEGLQVSPFKNLLVTPWGLWLDD